MLVNPWGLWWREMRASDVHEHADVVLPVAAVAEKPGTFVDWEGRPRTFEAARVPPEPALVDEAVTYYQTASRAFRQGALKAPGFGRS